MKATDQSSSSKHDEFFEDLVKTGRAEVEPVYYSINHGQTSANNKMKRGKAYRSVENNEYVCFVGFDGTGYKPGDCAYVDSQRLDQPYFIAGIQGFKMTKRDQLNVLVKWYYRPCEVPESVYRTLVQDRHSEHSSSTSVYLKDPRVQSRELFISDAVDTYPISSIRGKCVVHHLKDIGTRDATKQQQHQLSDDDSFFYVLGYNPENNRLASIQGEIRIGSNHQPRLPDYRPTAAAPGDPAPAGPDGDRVWETLTWSPGLIAESDIVMFLRAARSMAIFAGMCDGGSSEDGCEAAARDQTTISALNSLHGNNYDTGKALQELVKNPLPVSADKKWTEEETKKFVRGLKQYGKNFFKIQKELLSQKTTCDLVEFYYLWKKTSAANSQRPRQRQRRPQTTILRRVKPAPPSSGKPPRPASNEFLDLNSASENECDSDDSDAKDLTGYACHHCYTTTSKNWHHAGKDRSLLCVDCRLYFKKYGELRPVDRPRTPPPYLFTPVKENTPENSNGGGSSTNNNHGAGVKTRRGNKSTPGGNRRKTLTPTADMEKSARTSSSSAANATALPTPAAKSPSSSSTSSVGSNGAETVEKKSPKSKNNRKRKPSDKEETMEESPSKNHVPSTGGSKKKSRNRTETANSGGESSSSSSGGNEADTENTNDNSPSASHSPVNEQTLAAFALACRATTATTTTAATSATIDEPVPPSVSTATASVVKVEIKSEPVLESANNGHHHKGRDENSGKLIREDTVATSAGGIAGGGKNVYVFREDDDEHRLPESLQQYRLNVQHQQQQTVVAAPPFSVPPPLMAVSTNNNNNNNLHNAATVMSCATSVIRENFKVKEEMMEEARSDDENDYSTAPKDHSLPASKEPEPKIDDTECHKSANAIFRRHWYRGESNSCSRTDLVFIPKPDSHLAKKREENLRAKAVASSSSSKDDHHSKKERPSSISRPSTSGSSGGHFASPQVSSTHAVPSTPNAMSVPPSGVSGFVTPSTPYPPMPASAVYTPGLTPVPPTPLMQGASGGGSIPGQDLPFLARLKIMAEAVNSGGNNNPQYAAAYYQAAALMEQQHLQQRLMAGGFTQMEKERIEQEFRERQQEALQRDHDLAQKAAAMFQQTASQTPLGADPRQWLAAGLPFGGGPFAPPQQVNNNSAAAAAAALGLTPNTANHRMMPSGAPPGGYGFPASPAECERILSMLSAERCHLEQQIALQPVNPLLRLEFDRITGLITSIAGPQHHTHSHTHSHTHLHIHPSTGNPMPSGGGQQQHHESSAPSNAPLPTLWAPPSAAAAHPDALLLQYAMLRPTLGGGFVDAGFPSFPGVPPPGFGAPPGGMDPLGAERLHQLQQQEFQRRFMIEREQQINFANQQQAHAAVAHNEMMRRLQQEGGNPFPGLMGGQHPMMSGAGVIRPSPSPFDKR